MNNMGVDIYVNSFDSHDMLYANASMAAPYGGIKHFEGKKCWQALYTDKTGECEFCPKRHLIDENGQPTRVYSWDYQRPFDKCWFRVFSAAFPWIDGQMAHVITSVDIDHQKKIEEELRIAKEKAENLDRLKSAFLANMSHEIRTPLNAIVGFSQVLIDEEDQEARRQFADIIQSNNDLLQRLISDVLDISKIESNTISLHYAEYDLPVLMSEIYNVILLRMNEGVELQLADCPPCMLYIDRNRLTQVLTNLLTNAIKHTKAGFIRFGYEAAESEVCFFVQDTGEGIPEEQQEQIFSRFVQLDDWNKGVGLGLAICKGLLEKMNGSIRVTSKVGEGSVFYVKLPRV